MNLSHKRLRLNLIVYFFLLLPTFVYSQKDIKAVNSGNWNDPSTWDLGVPSSIDKVIIQKGLTVWIDTAAVCVTASLSMETGSKLVFSPTSGETASLVVYGPVNLQEKAEIVLSPLTPNTTVYFKTFDFIILEKESTVSLFHNIDSFVRLDIYGIKIGKDCSFKYYILNPLGRSDILITNVENDGTFEVRNFTDAINKISLGKVLNKSKMYFIGPDPNVANQNKPDPPTTPRKLVIEGLYNESYINTIRENDYNEMPSVGLVMLNVKVVNVGVWDGRDKNGNPIYGIGFIGKVAPIDGSCDFITIYNSEIVGSADTGIFYKNCKRINKDWGKIGISSNVIYNCKTAGIWFMDEVEKCDVGYNIIYNVGGGNVGYGILLGMPIRYGTPSAKGFANENNLFKNTVHNNKLRGIYLYHSNKNLIDSNICYGHSEEGISLKNSIKNVVILNECFNNDVYGIALDGVHNDPKSGSRQNYIANNKCFNNKNSGLRVRYNSNQNIFINNISSNNARAGITSHSSVGNLFVNEEYLNNGWGDIYIEGEQNQGYISQMWLKNCLLGSPTEFVNTPEKQEFTKENSWVFSQCHDRILGLTRIWGQFSFPDSYHSWHTNDTLKFVYDEPLYQSKSHGWNTTLTQYDTPMLRYDDGGVDGPEGTNDITSVTITSTTKAEVWLVTYNVENNKWIVRGTVSGVQTKLLTHDTDYESDNGEIKLRITHRYSPIAPGEQYVFVTIKGSNDEGVQKVVNLCDFSEPVYIGASMKILSGGTLEIAGKEGLPVVFTRKLAEDKKYSIIAATEDFYYGVSFGGQINRIEYASFTFLNSDGLELNSSPIKNTKNVYISRIQPSPQSCYITANNISHTFDNIILDTTTASLGVVSYNVKAYNSVLVFRDYLRAFLPDRVENSVIYWDPTIVWSGLSGFTDDGVEPNSINKFNSVEFTIKYIDLNNNPPTTVQVWVDLDDDLMFSSTEQFGMKLKPAVGNDGDYTNGEIYHFVLSNINYPSVPSLGRSGGKIKYRFYATNPYSFTISTYSFNLYNVFNKVISVNEATGVGTQIQTFSVRGTPPVVKVETPIGEQTDLVRINYILYDYDDKPEPYNLCSIKVEYREGATWKEATRHDSSEPTENLAASLVGTPHYFIWDSRKDLPNKNIPTAIRITPKDEDGVGSPVETSSFQIDNIIATQLVFLTPPQELKTGSTSQLIIVQAQDENGNKDLDINGTLNLITTSTGGVFLSINDVVISSVNMVSGEARFKYRDDIAGSPIITVSLAGLSPAQQTFYITKNISVLASTVRILLNEEVDYAELPVGTTVTIVVSLKDVDLQPVVGKEVLIYATGSDFIITQPQSPTNQEGKVYATLFTTKAEPKIITARVKGENLLLVSSATINFYPLDPSSENSTIIVSKNTAIVGETVSVVVTLLDKYKNPIGSSTPMGLIPVYIKVKDQPSEDVLVMLSTFTDIDGRVRALYTGNIEGLKIFTAETDKIVLTATATVNFVLGDISPPSVVSVYPPNNSIITQPINQISIELSDVSGISESSTTIILYGPDNRVIAGTKSFSNNIFMYSFSPLNIDGTYRIQLIAVDLKGNSQEYNFYFSIQTKDAQKVFSASLFLYPNPTEIGKVTVRYNLLNNADINVKIYNILGELIFESNYSDTAGEGKIFEWLCKNNRNEDVASGVYIIKFLVEDKVLNKKFNINRKVVVIKK
ncbi:MAG: NosD domain-containing protein [Elusimicrobiota bacterium]|nr:right-handed parallel beta-helix repeat-containing protein [Endomicrobiia bacterium]MDW8165731.1 NosD domain-containing protein [Elusimicrobiota bacterium]